MTHALEVSPFGDRIADAVARDRAFVGALLKAKPDGHAWTTASPPPCTDRATRRRTAARA